MILILYQDIRIQDTDKKTKMGAVPLILGAVFVTTISQLGLHECWVVGISKRNKDFWRITQIFFSLNSD
jgi:hypothetical protein